MAVLMLDTDVFSYLSASDQRRALPYQPHLTWHTLTLSFITVGEQYAGYTKQIVRGNWNAAHLEKLEVRLRSVAIVPYDIEVCRTYGDLRAALDQHGISVSANDLWIAACAKRHSLPLVTHNRKHFAAIPGLRIISEAP